MHYICIVHTVLCLKYGDCTIFTLFMILLQDLFSVLIEGPVNTPYEGGLFLFDVMLPEDYPTSPPILHFHSYSQDRLNPNLYADGKVCVSLLGTWSGKVSNTESECV